MRIIRRKGGAVAPMTLYLPEPIARGLAVMAAASGERRSDIVAALLHEWLSKEVPRQIDAPRGKDERR